MKIRIFIMLGLAGFLLLPVCAIAEGYGGKMREYRHEQMEKRKEFREEEHKENQEFHKSLKSMTPEQRAEAMKKHHAEEIEERKAFHTKMHEENMEALKSRLANNSKLTDAQKNELTAFFENQYQENVSFRDAQHKENMEFFAKIANDSGLTMEQKKQAIREHRQQQKAKNKEHHQEQKSERKTKMQEIKSQK